MSLSTNSVEWHRLTEDEADDPNWPYAPAEDAQPDHTQRDSLQRFNSHPKLSRLYELVLVVAVLYGVAIFMVWYRAEQQITSLEDEVAVLRSEREQPLTDNTAESVDSPYMGYEFETEYLRIKTSPQTAELVRSISDQVDVKYQQLHQQFGLPLDPLADNLTLSIDLDERPEGHNAHMLTIPSPKVASKRYGITEADALNNEIYMRMSKYVFDKALQGRDIKPQWRHMVLGLSFYIQRENGHEPTWRQDSFYLQWRHMALRQSVTGVYYRNNATQISNEEEPQSTSAEEIADPLVEYIVGTFGYSVVPLLLNAFEEHSSWGTLAPELFGGSLEEFENDWHDYLSKNYSHLDFE